jgi:RimJ/RimL family protein N-acetyltransferase
LKEDRIREKELPFGLHDQQTFIQSIRHRLGKNEQFDRAFQDRRGCSLRARPAENRDYHGILEMYDSFEPKESAQGLPPADPVRRQNWVHQIVSGSINVLAEADEKVVGHASLLEMQRGECCELEIAVHQEWQNRGIGTELTRLLVDIARTFGYCRIWLTVENLNRRAIHVYEKCGFGFIGPFEAEREMELCLDGFKIIKVCE